MRISNERKERKRRFLMWMIDSRWKQTVQIDPA
jgi:hypothetical protein